MHAVLVRNHDKIFYFWLHLSAAAAAALVFCYWPNCPVSL